MADEAEPVSLPLDRQSPKLAAQAADDLFAVRASGSSMNGGTRPIADGDWLIMRYARGASLGDLAGRLALIQLADDAGAGRYQVKRIVRHGKTWLLRSDNPSAPSFEATADAIPIALLADIVRPEELAPRPGTLLADDHLAAAFGLSARPVPGRSDGHYFVFVEEKGPFAAPDRLDHPAPKRPGETAYVLARAQASDPWRYCGVAH